MAHLTRSGQLPVNKWQKEPCNQSANLEFMFLDQLTPHLTVLLEGVCSASWVYLDVITVALMTREAGCQAMHHRLM